MTGAAPRPRAAIVVTGSELVRGDRNDRNGPFLARELVALGLEPSRITIVGDGPSELERRARARRSRPISASSRAASARRTTTARSSCSRAPRASTLVVDAELERGDRGASRARSPSGCGARTRTSRPASTKQATLPAGAASLGLAGTAPGFVVPCGRARSSSSCPGRRASCSGSGRARSSTELVRGRARAGAAARSARAALLRRQRVGGRARARGGRRRRRRRRGDDLRARLRDPRRPVRRAGRGGARRLRSAPSCASRSTATSSPRTSGRSRRSCSTSAARSA